MPPKSRAARSTGKKKHIHREGSDGGSDKGLWQRLVAPGKTKSEISMVVIVAPAVVMTIVAVVWFFAEQWMLGPAVNVPLDVPRAVSDDWRNDSVYRDRLWGTYRSNVYFGVRPRIPKSLISGAMWFTHQNGRSTDIRHTCEHGDHLQRYGWIRHDGTTFGQQEIVDNVLELKTDFFTRADPRLGETWTARFTGTPLIQRPVLVSLILYVYNEGEGEMEVRTSQRDSIEEVYGFTPEFSEFRVHFNRQSISKDTVHSYLSAWRSSIAGLTDFVKEIMKQGTPRKNWPPILQLPGNVGAPDGKKFKPNLVAYQITTSLPFEIDMVFETGMFGAALSISGERLSNAIRSKEMEFDQRFENTFQLKAKNFSDSKIAFAKAAFSNLIGGISYFYGKSLVTSKELSEPVLYWPTELYTAVPSRSFFPRGFLWDEGFHQMIITHWDITIVKDVLAHWMDLINIEGWLPREQILGEEARSKVPHEFVVQHNEYGNPPTFFLTLETLIHRMEKENKMDLEFLRRLFPRLEAWFEWFNVTQVGSYATTYRWRGRNSTTDRELNPKTLTSGLDDYPRATHPTEEEYHVDLRCWMALASGVMAKISNLLEENSRIYKLQYKTLTDQKLLDRLHWNPRKKAYSDWGLHGGVKLETVKPQRPEQNFRPYKRRTGTREPTLRFVNTFGYVNLFPFLLRIVSPTSEKLGYILNKLRNESLLWTKYGLRSLAKNDRFYNEYNTEHDPPYWRGPIWLNMNYLAVRALHHYGNNDGPYRKQSRKLYQELRSNLIRNMHEQYLRTGYIWEQYDDDIGVGKGTHPFTGWSSLIVLIMAEKY